MNLSLRNHRLGLIQTLKKWIVAKHENGKKMENENQARGGFWPLFSLQISVQTPLKIQ
jgi:hypothetical protein